MNTSSFSDVAEVVLGLFFIGLVIAAVYGWVANVFKFIGMLTDNTVTAMLVAPLGALLGWF